MATRTDGAGGTASARETTPAQLAATWKKSGGFDSLRKQLLADFLNAPEKDKFLADLDVSLPALLASTPSIARQERKDRPNAVIRSMKQIETLKPQIKLTERRLREDETVAKRIDHELARALCKLRGVPFVEEPEPTATVPAEVGAGERSGPSPIPKGGELPTFVKTAEVNDSITLAPPTPIKTEPVDSNGSTAPPHLVAAHQSERSAPAATPSTEPAAAPLPPAPPSDLEDVDMPAVEAESSTGGVDSKDAILTGQVAVPGAADDDVDMKPSVPDVSEGST